MATPAWSGEQADALVGDAAEPEFPETLSITT